MQAELCMDRISGSISETVLAKNDEKIREKAREMINEFMDQSKHRITELTIQRGLIRSDKGLVLNGVKVLILKVESSDAGGAIRWGEQADRWEHLICATCHR